MTAVVTSALRIEVEPGVKFTGGREVVGGAEEGVGERDLPVIRPRTSSCRCVAGAGAGRVVRLVVDVAMTASARV